MTWPSHHYVTGLEDAFCYTSESITVAFPDMCVLIGRSFYLLYQVSSWELLKHLDNFMSPLNMYQTCLLSIAVLQKISEMYHLVYLRLNV